MPRFVIERQMPGAGSLTADQLKAAAQTSCGVLNALGPAIQWIESYVTDDKIYCTSTERLEQATSRSTPGAAVFRPTRSQRSAPTIRPTTAEGP